MNTNREIKNTMNTQTTIEKNNTMKILLKNKSKAIVLAASVFGAVGCMSTGNQNTVDEIDKFVSGSCFFDADKTDPAPDWQCAPPSEFNQNYVTERGFAQKDDYDLSTQFRLADSRARRGISEQLNNRIVTKFTETFDSRTDQGKVNIESFTQVSSEMELPKTQRHLYAVAKNGDLWVLIRMPKAEAEKAVKQREDWVKKNFKLSTLEDGGNLTSVPQVDGSRTSSSLQNARNRLVGKGVSELVNKVGG